eukprot:Gregarina_sp_Poly_1__8403@NODE_493_length_7956_cov_236_715173_g397_i0_p6_GENE_NODE_493_length_7956_cov_236_715173_g397_i0NODE_493_length_7956_cov_236_715173_g397_i0_p6_ORF_typecomplete_len181_score2_71Fbox/PF00646_33/0_03Fboxlike/PF12937_7/0_23_NODE_493_length_7956_cov_236_715173_g397_i031353677
MASRRPQRPERSKPSKSADDDLGFDLYGPAPPKKTSKDAKKGVKEVAGKTKGPVYRTRGDVRPGVTGPAAAKFKKGGLPTVPLKVMELTPIFHGVRRQNIFTKFPFHHIWHRIYSFLNTEQLLKISLVSKAFQMHLHDATLLLIQPIITISTYMTNLDFCESKLKLLIPHNRNVVRAASY